MEEDELSADDKRFDQSTSDRLKQQGFQAGTVAYELNTGIVPTKEALAKSALSSGYRDPKWIELRRFQNAGTFYMVVATLEQIWLPVEEKERAEYGEDYFLTPDIMLTGWVIDPMKPQLDPGQPPNARCLLYDDDDVDYGAAFQYGVFQALSETPDPDGVIRYE
jgi:hypothetical protein